MMERSGPRTLLFDPTFSLPREHPVLSRAFALFLFLLPGALLHSGQDRIRVSGTGSALGGLALLARAYERVRPGVRIEIFPGIGSGGAVRAVRDGRLDLACTARPLEASERGPALREEPFARTPFVFATHPQTQVRPFTLPELEQVYAGGIQTWPNHQRIRLILRPRSDQAHRILCGASPGMSAALERAHRIPGVCVGMTDGEAADRIEESPGSLGTTTLGLIQSEARRIRPLALNGVVPSLEALEKGHYPLSVELSFVYASEAPPGLGEFLAYVFSPEGARILRRVGHLPLPRRGSAP